MWTLVHQVKALLTCAHADIPVVLRNFRNPVIRSIYGRRKTRISHYKESIGSVLQFSSLFDSIVVLECLKSKVPTYLKRGKGYKTAVSRNVLQSKNKGAQEFVNIGNYLLASGTDGDELVLKLTGRYVLTGDFFPKLCAATDADVFAKEDRELWGERGKGFHTFLFAARARVLVQFRDWLMDNTALASLGDNPVEWCFKEFVEHRNFNIRRVSETLGVRVRYADSDRDLLL